MIEFLNNIEDKEIKFAVIISRTNDGEWVLCKHKEKNTFEFPGGHREKSETILETAKRELFEETGAIQYDIEKIGIYSNIENKKKSYGMLYYADIKKFESIPKGSEIEKIEITESLEGYNWTYPIIQENLIKYIKEYIINRNIKELKNYVKNVTLKEETGHDWWHIERVYNTSITIAKKEKAQRYIVEIISLIHDLYDHKFFNGNPEKEIMRTLKDFNLTKDLSTKDIDNIVNSCLNLGYSSNIEEKKELSLEGKIVQDSDRLDAIGAIGIARTFAYGGKAKRNIYDPDVGIIEIRNKNDYNNLNRHSINHFYEKLLKLKDLMNTEEAKRIAKSRHEFMQRYLEEFFEEWKGKK